MDLHRDGEAASLERIVEFMGLTLAPEVIDAARKQFTFSEMRERSARIAEQPPEALMNGDQRSGHVHARQADGRRRRHRNGGPQGRARSA